MPELSGVERLVSVLRAPAQESPVIGAEQTPRTFRMGVVTAISPLAVKFNNDPLAVVTGLPSISYVPVVGDLVVVAVFEGGAMCVLGTTSRGGQRPWAMPWGVWAVAGDSTPRNSSVNSGAALTVFPTLNFTPIANRWYEVHWHATYVINLLAGSNGWGVSLVNQAGTLITNLSVGVAGANEYKTLNAILPIVASSFPVGTTGLQIVAVASAASAFTFQYANYPAWMSVKDTGPAAAP